MPPRFKPTTDHNCQYCGSVIRQYRDSLRRDGRGMSLCRKSGTRKHEPGSSGTVMTTVR